MIIGSMEYACIQRLGECIRIANALVVVKVLFDHLSCSADSNFIIGALQSSGNFSRGPGAGELAYDKWEGKYKSTLTYHLARPEGIQAEIRIIILHDPLMGAISFP